MYEQVDLALATCNRPARTLVDIAGRPAQEDNPMTVEPIDLEQPRLAPTVTPLRAFVCSSAVAVAMVTVALRAGQHHTTPRVTTTTTTRYGGTPALQIDIGATE